MVTIKDVARESGVSHATVSYVLNGKAKQARIGDEACERIKAVAARLGYQRNALARSMVTGRNDVLAFVAYNTGTWEYTGKILAGVMEEATRGDFALKVFHLERSAPDDVIRRLLEQRVAGVIFHSSRHDEFAQIQEAMARARIPCATVNLSNPAAGFGVTSDDFQGTRDAVGHLAGLGHRRIAYLTRKASKVEYVVNRESGYLAGTRAAFPGAEPRVEDTGDLLKILSDPPTALVCDSDYAACDALRAAYELGLRVPRDLSLVGFADLEIAKNAVVPLTTVAQPFAQMGREAAAALLDALGGRREIPLDKTENWKLAVKLVVRGSTAAPSNP